jgi:hypothetical protein
MIAVPLGRMPIAGQRLTMAALVSLRAEGRDGSHLPVDGHEGLMDQFLVTESDSIARNLP